MPVVTTELLASLYGTEPDYIRKNFNRNSGRFVIGKHYFLLENEKLREFKHSMSLRPSVKIARNVRSLILWTERGAARHAKMLETDRAWEVFEKLEDCYFSQGKTAPTEQQPQIQPQFTAEEIILLCYMQLWM
ncbi:ORF6N domain-containing protein, partial [Escherichia coli]|uniref:ORF6N domain-containing protein n=1 Tax=Escherichia coli TaxID=562 RepID=UPI004055E2A4